jgi:hypothetical protein
VLSLLIVNSLTGTHDFGYGKNLFSSSMNSPSLKSGVDGRSKGLDASAFYAARFRETAIFDSISPLLCKLKMFPSSSFVQSTPLFSLPSSAVYTPALRSSGTQNNYSQ